MSDQPTPTSDINAGDLVVACLLGGLLWAAILLLVTNIEHVLGWLGRIFA